MPEQDASFHRAMHKLHTQQYTSNMQSLIREHKTTPIVTESREVHVDNKLSTNESLDQLLEHNKLFCEANTLTAMRNFDFLANSALELSRSATQLASITN